MGVKLISQHSFRVVWQFRFPNDSPCMPHLVLDRIFKCAFKVAVVTMLSHRVYHF
jgi:hypothetical protein